MPRPILVTTLILSAFGVGFAARSVVEMRTPGAAGPSPGIESEETLGSIQTTARPAAPIPPADIPSSSPAPAATEAPPAPTDAAPPTRLSASPPAQASVTTPTPPLTQPSPLVSAPISPPASPPPGIGQLAYAPIVRESPEPPPGLAPPPTPAEPVVVAPPVVTPPVVAEREPAPPKLAPFPAGDVDAMRDVIAQMRKGDIAAADAAIKKLSDPVARTLGEWTLLRSGQRAVGFPRILSFIEKDPSWPTQPLLQRRAEEALSAEQRPNATVRAFFANRKPITVGGRVALARAYLADKQRDDAATLIRTIWREDNLSDVLEDRIATEFAELLRKEDHRARMERHIFRENTVRALRAAARASKDHAALVKARQAVENKAANAKALLDAVPKALHNDSSFMFASAQLARRQDKLADAVKAMEGAPRDPTVLVSGDDWWEERRIITRKLLDAGDYKLAYKAAAEHGAESDAMRVEAEFHAGWIALRYLKDAKLAATHFDKAAEAAKLPMSLSRVAYWQGRAAEAAGDAAAAEAHYKKAASHSGFFYGQLARAKLPATAVIETDSAATPQASADIGNDRALRAIDLLLSLNERDLAMSMIVDLARDSGTRAQLDALGGMLTERRDARGVLVMGKLAMQRGVALDRHAFPTFGIPAYQSLTNIVEVPMVHAIARQESAFDPKAVSHAGARGLMQLMPGTARVTAVRYKTPFDVNRLTGDPPYNAQIGSAHLGDLLDEWRGSYILVFAAYNAGSHNVKKWIAANGDPRSPNVDPVDWIERIPYNETRNYVQRVMENVQVYRTRLTPGAPLTIEADMKRNAVPVRAAPAVVAGDQPAAARTP